MKNINTLLKRYSKPYVKGEIRSAEYNKKIKQKQRQKDKENIAETLFQEVPFHLTQGEKEQVLYMIRIYPNFRDLHGKASNETIILAFIFYIKMSNKQIKLERYTITEKYELTHSTFELILCRLIKNHFQTRYLLPEEPTDKKHDILKKGEVK